jgi:thioredoxin reductase
MQNFVSRDGTPPTEFRAMARAQLERYPNVEVRDARIEEIRGEHGNFNARLASGDVQARRVLLCAGMIDELPELDGFRALWGTSVFQCPYCHGWEHRDRRFGVLASSIEMLEHALFIRGWSKDVVGFTDARYTVPPELRMHLERARMRVEERRITRLSGSGTRLEQVELEGGASVPLDVLFARPAQRQVPIVQALGVMLDDKGYVQADALSQETSIPGIYAGGDLITPFQAAVLAAASGTRAAASLNHALTVELAKSGALP